MAERAVNISMASGGADGYLYYDGQSAPRPGVLLFTDGFGVRPAMRVMAQRLSESGYSVLMPNPFYRDGSASTLDYTGVDEHLPEAVARFGAFSRNASHDGGILHDIRAALQFLEAQSEVARGPFGCTGYCMGGHFSLQAAGHFPDRIRAAASFHGGSLATDSPNSPHRLAHAMTGDIYIGVAEIDPFLRPGETYRLQGALEGAAVEHTLEFYEGAEHGFTVPSNVQYCESAAERHWDALRAFFERTLSERVTG